jgi:uncharacterized protein YbjT (DUF2867 family)
MRKLDVLVVGATGRQGGAVAYALLRAGHHVRAMTRTLAHPEANALRLRGARLAWADLDDERRLREAVDGADAVFLVTPRSGKTSVEARHGLLVAEAAREAGVSHLVFAAGAGPGPTPRHDPRLEVEQYIRSTQVPHTILRPAFLMENLLADWCLDRLQQGELPLATPPGRKLQQLALAYLARFVCLVLERRDEFLNRSIALASDELSPIEMAATLARVLGHGIRYDPQRMAQLHADNDAAAAAFEWLWEGSADADVAALRRDYDEVNWHTLDGWARRQQWQQAQSSGSGGAPARPA